MGTLRWIAVGTASMLLLGCEYDATSGDYPRRISSDGTTTTDGTEQHLEEAPIDAGKASTGGNTTSTTPSTGQNPALCKGLSAQACTACCNIAFQPVADAMKKALFNCFCSDPGECASACGANVCKGAATTSACSTCIDKTTVCGPATESLCKSSPDCVAWSACLAQCK